MRVFVSALLILISLNAAAANRCEVAFNKNAPAQQSLNSVEDFFSDSNVLPKIKLPEINDYVGIRRENGTADVLAARYNSRDIVLKFRSALYGRRTDQNRELTDGARWLQWLNTHNIGAKFYGVTKFRGSAAVVMERVTEEHRLLKEPNNIEDAQAEAQQFAREGFKINAHTRAELNRTIDLLIANNISAVDIQFLVTKSGRLVLIDPDHFAIHDPNSTITPPSRLGENARALFLEAFADQSP